MLYDAFSDMGRSRSQNLDICRDHKSYQRCSFRYVGDDGVSSVACAFFGFLSAKEGGEEVMCMRCLYV